MSSGLPPICGRQAISALKTIGFQQVSQKGSHVKLRNREGRTVIVPLHGELARGTLASIARQAGITIQGLREAL